MANDMIFKTIHGSHLYGTDHPDSDIDIFKVFRDKMKTRHVIDIDSDTTSMSLDSFLLTAGKGNPQSLEAMFSQNYSISEIEPLRSAFRVDLGTTIETYRRTIKNFAHGNLKQQRHAFRLAHNLDTLYASGSFNPRLSDKQIEEIFSLELSEPQELIDFLSLRFTITI